MNFNTNYVCGQNLTRIFEEFISYCDDAHTAEITHSERKQGCVVRESRIVYDVRRNAFTADISVCVSYSHYDEVSRIFSWSELHFYICDGNTRWPGRYQSVHLYAVAFSSESSELFLPRIQETLRRRHVYRWRHYAQAWILRSIHEISDERRMT